MIRLLKQRLCKHDFQLIKTYIDDGDESLGYKRIEFAIIYCPRCKKQQTISKMSFDVMNEMKRVDKEHVDNLKRFDEEINNKKSGK